MIKMDTRLLRSIKKEHHIKRQRYLKTWQTIEK